MWAKINSSLSQVHVQSPVGSPPVAISAPNRSVTGMAVAEDGSMIAISYDGSPAELYMGPTDGGPAQLVRSSTGWIRVFAISPDVSQVAFMEGYQFEDGAKLLPLDGGPAMLAMPRTMSFTALTGAAFSPDSRYFMSSFYGSGVHVTDTRTGVMTPVIPPSSPTETADIMRFAWTSESTFLFVAFNLSGMTSVGSLHGCVAPDSCVSLPAFTGARTLNVSRESRVAVVGVDAADAGVGYLDIFRAPLDGGAPTLLTADFGRSSGAWALSADGERLMVQHTVASGRAISVLPTLGFSQLTPLFILPTGIGAEIPAFGPDSTQLIFRSNLETLGSPTASSWGLQRIDLAAPAQTPILQQAVDGGIVWQFQWTR